MIFCIGNGESRKDFDLETLRPHGKIYGANGLYRDFTPDILLAMDYNICHEIYRSGYAFENICYLRQWSKNPATVYENLFKKETVDKFIGKDIAEPKLTHLDEHEWEGEKKKFFVCWANNRDLMAKLREDRIKNGWNEDDLKLYLSKDQEGYLITWTKRKDKVQGLGKYYYEKTNAGTLIALMASDKDSKIYLIGYDYYSETEQVNNIYKGTKGYVGKSASAIKPKNWLDHTEKLCKKYPQHEYVHVGKPIDKFKDIPNLTNISYAELNERIKNNKV